MNVLDRAQQAASAARLTSETGVNVMTALLETKQKAEAKRRNSRWVTVGAAAGAVVVAAGVAVGLALTMNGDDGSTSDPAAPAPTASSAAPATYGQAMDVPVSAPLPVDWTVGYDENPVGFWSPSGTQTGTALASIWLVEPTTVFDPVTLAAIPAPTDYVGWLRAHPWLDVVSESSVEVDGRPASKFEFVVVDTPAIGFSPGQSATGFTMHYVTGGYGQTGYYELGDSMTLTVVDVGGRPLVFEGYRISAGSEFAAAYDEVVDGTRILN